LTLTDLKRVAEAGGYKAVLGKITVDKLIETKLPLVVGITVDEYDHFVVCRGSDGEFVYLADPIFGKKKVPVEEFALQWQKNAILAVIKPNTKPKLNSPLLVSETERNSVPGYQNFLRNAITGRRSF
jgi:predicted double-glycine peptidase